MRRVDLARTDEPVWPQDEADEREQRRRDGLEPIRDLSDDAADEALRDVRVELPDVLLARPLDDVTSASLPGHLAGFVPQLFVVPVTFEAPERLTLRRVRLTLTIESPEHGLVLWLEPPSTVHHTTSQVAELGIDFGKAVRLIFPTIPDVFTAKIHGAVDVSSVNPVIQASGALTRICSWVVSDSEMAYGFNPQVVMGVPATEGLAISAELHVEVRARILRVFHKTYGKNASSKRYSLTWASDGLVPLGWENDSDSSAAGVIQEMALAASKLPPDQRKELLQRLALDEVARKVADSLEGVRFDLERGGPAEPDDTARRE